MIRLNKLMSQLKLASRREADQLIKSGSVFHRPPSSSSTSPSASSNSFIKAEVGLMVPASFSLDDITIERSTSSILSPTEQTVILHKPIGFVSSQPEKVFDPKTDKHTYRYSPSIQLLEAANFHTRSSSSSSSPSAFSFLNPRHQQNAKSFATIGRLDVDSTGLLILSRDGTLAKAIIDENSRVEKEYLVKVNNTGDNSEIDLKSLFDQSDGYDLFLKNDPRPLKKIPLIEWAAQGMLRIVLEEGRKRQIRRMVEEIMNLKTVALKRVRVGEIRLDDLKSGTWRYIEKSELDAFFK